MSLELWQEEQLKRAEEDIQDLISGGSVNARDVIDALINGDVTGIELVIVDNRF